MELTDGVRSVIGKMVGEQIRAKYQGEKMALYRAADVNSGTLDRLLDGQPVRASTLAKVIAEVWPHTAGDWERLVQTEAWPGEPTRPYVMDPDAAADAQGALISWVQAADPDNPPPTAALELWTASQLAEALARKVNELEVEMLALATKETPNDDTASNAQAGRARHQDFSLAADDLNKAETEGDARDGLMGQD